MFTPAGALDRSFQASGRGGPSGKSQLIAMLTGRLTELGLVLTVTKKKTYLSIRKLNDLEFKQR